MKVYIDTWIWDNITFLSILLKKVPMPSWYSDDSNSVVLFSFAIERPMIDIIFHLNKRPVSFYMSNPSQKFKKVDISQYLIVYKVVLATDTKTKCHGSQCLIDNLKSGEKHVHWMKQVFKKSRQRLLAKLTQCYEAKTI